MNYNQIINWIKNNFSNEELADLEYSDWEMDNDAYLLANKYLINGKYNWRGERVSFKNYVFIFKYTELLGYYNDGKFTERTCINEWDLCQFYEIQYINPFNIKEDKWGVLKHKNKNLYVGIETPIGYDLVENIYNSYIIGENEWERFKKDGYKFYSEFHDGEIDNNDLEFLEIEIKLIS